MKLIQVLDFLLSENGESAAYLRGSTTVCERLCRSLPVILESLWLARHGEEGDGAALEKVFGLDGLRPFGGRLGQGRGGQRVTNFDGHGLWSLHGDRKPC